MTSSLHSPLALALALACAGPGCDRDEMREIAQSAETTGEVDPARAAVDEARAELVTYLDLHTSVIARTCTPNMGVCHNIKEYPDLHTPQTMLGIVDQPCNLAETEPLHVYSGCERVGDRIELVGPSNPGFSSEVGHVEHELDAVTGEARALVIRLRDAPANAMLDPASQEGLRVWRTTRQGVIEVGALSGRVTYTGGEAALRIDDVAALAPEERALVEVDVVPGDPNRDGVFGGSEDPLKLVVPGDPQRSYLLQRLLGTVPGSPMPLANEPLRAAEIVALACWIEGLAGAGSGAAFDAIDYEHCRTAAEFGVPDPDSGHALAADVQPIFDAACALSGCHDEASAGAGLVLTAGKARAHLLAASTQLPDARRVEPGNPTASYLVDKLTGSARIRGAAMPMTPGRLADADIAVIRAWIVAGAPED